MVFDVGLQGSRPRVGFSLHIAGYVFRTLFKSKAVEGGVSAGIPRMSRLLSTLLLLVVLICGSLLLLLSLLLCALVCSTLLMQLSLLLGVMVCGSILILLSLLLGVLIKGSLLVLLLLLGILVSVSYTHLTLPTTPYV